jgi:MSHA biogenesis protein MshN
MSLINQVLQDLDRRHAMAGAIPTSARSAIEVTRPPARFRWNSPLGAGAAGVALAMIAWSITDHSALSSTASRWLVAASPTGRTLGWSAEAAQARRAEGSAAAQVPAAPLRQTEAFPQVPSAVAFRADRASPNEPADAGRGHGRDDGEHRRDDALRLAVDAEAPATLATSSARGRLASHEAEGDAIARRAAPVLASRSVDPLKDTTEMRPGAEPRLPVAPSAQLAPPPPSAPPATASVRLAMAPLAAPARTETTSRSPSPTGIEAGPSELPAASPARAANPRPIGPNAVPAAPAGGEARVEKRAQPISLHERANADYQRGLVLHQQGRGQEAEAAFAAALKAEPNHLPALEAAAVALLDSGRAEDAQRLLAAALERGPQPIRLGLLLARMKAQQRDVAGAMTTLESVLAGSSGGEDRAEARALLATLQQGVARHREAVDNFAAALRQAPDRGAWWIAMGISLAAEGRSESAREAFNRARSMDSLTPDLRQYVEQRLASTPTR